MKTNFSKVVALACLSLLFFACTKSKEPEPELIPEEVPEEIIFGENQVYFGRNNAGFPIIPYEGTCNVVGVPASFSGTQIFTSTYIPEDLPWVIEGKINNGVMEIAFPEEIGRLDSSYVNIFFTEGVRIARIFLWNEEARSNHFALHKWDNDAYGEILVYYSEENFSKFNNGTIELGRGWNFIEMITTDKKGREFGKISQDINEFIQDGYRWEIELWCGTGPNS